MKVCNYLFISEFREFFEVKRIMHNCFLYGSQGRTSRGPGTVGLTLGIENRCRSVEVTLQGSGGYVAGPGNVWGPGPVRPGTGDRKERDLGRQSVWKGKKRRRSRREMRTRDGMAGDLGQHNWGPGTERPTARAQHRPAAGQSRPEGADHGAGDGGGGAGAAQELADLGVVGLHGLAVLLVGDQAGKLGI